MQAVATRQWFEQSSAIKTLSSSGRGRDRCTRLPGVFGVAVCDNGTMSGWGLVFLLGALRWRRWAGSSPRGASTSLVFLWEGGTTSCPHLLLAKEKQSCQQTAGPAAALASPAHGQPPLACLLTCPAGDRCLNCQSDRGNNPQPRQPRLRQLNCQQHRQEEQHCRSRLRGSPTAVGHQCCLEIPSPLMKLSGFLIRDWKYFSNINISVNSGSFSRECGIRGAEQPFNANL